MGSQSEGASSGRRGLHWRWVLFGVALMVLGHVGAYLLAGRRVIALVERDPVLAFGIAAVVPLLIFFFSGLLVGRLSPGRTIQEPAVAAVLGLLAVVGLQLFAGMINIFGLLLGAPFSFAAAYFGGWVGEVWQSRAQRRSLERLGKS